MGSLPKRGHKNVSPKQFNKPASAFEFGQEFAKFPPAPVGPPPPAPKAYKPPPSPAKVNPNQPCKISMRQDSSVSSDSFSQTSSPSYTTKTMETPLIPPRTPVHKQNGVLKAQQATEDAGNGTIITKSVSTPASLQTIVRFHNGSNMSLHHRVSLRVIQTI